MNRMKCISSILLSGVLSLALVGCSTGNQETSLPPPVNEPIAAVSDTDTNNDEQVSNSIKKINILGTKYAELNSYETVSWEFEIDSVNGDVDVDNIEIKTDRKDKVTDDNYLFLDRIEKLNNGNYKLSIVGGITTGECNAWLEIDGVKSDSIKVKVDASNKDEGDELRTVNYETLCFQVPKKLVDLSADDNICVCKNNINTLVICKYNIDYTDYGFNKQFALDVFTSMSESFTFDKDSIIGVNKEQYSYFCVNIDLENKNDTIAYLLLDSVNHNLYFCTYGNHKGQLTDADRKCAERIINSIKIEDLLKLPSDMHEEDKAEQSKIEESRIEKIKNDESVFEQSEHEESKKREIENEQSVIEESRIEEKNYGEGTMWKLNAVSTAKRYLDSFAFSRDELIEQLEYEKFTHEQAVYGVDNCNADWNVQAIKKAKEYLKTTAFSKDGLIEQLEYEQFTNSQAIYGANNCDVNWSEQAVKKAKEYLNTMTFSRDELVDQLEYEKFTNEQARYGADNCNANWNEQAVRKAKEYLNTTAFSKDELIEQLEYEGFNHEQAVYGVSNCGADWSEQAVKKAKDYVKILSCSKDELVEFLEDDGFSHEQAVYAANQVK